MSDSIETPARKRLHIVAGRFNRSLTEDIASHLGVELTSAEIATFANGEIHCRFADSIRGGDVFIVQSHGADECGSINDAIVEQLTMVDAAKRASAKRVTAVAPFYGYARQDRKSEGREPITAKLVANMFEVAGAKRLVSIDLHSGQIQGFFDGPVDHLTAMPVLAAHLAELDEDLVVVSPDSGRLKTAERYAKQLHAEVRGDVLRQRPVEAARDDVEPLARRCLDAVAHVARPPQVPWPAPGHHFGRWRAGGKAGWTAGSRLREGTTRRTVPPTVSRGSGGRSTADGDGDGRKCVSCRRRRPQARQGRCRRRRPERPRRRCRRPC